MGCSQFCDSEAISVKCQATLIGKWGWGSPASRDAFPAALAAVRVKILRKDRCPRGDTGRDAEVLKLLSLSWIWTAGSMRSTSLSWPQVLGWTLPSTSIDRPLSGLEPGSYGMVERCRFLSLILNFRTRTYWWGCEIHLFLKLPWGFLIHTKETWRSFAFPHFLGL